MGTNKCGFTLFMAAEIGAIGGHILVVLAAKAEIRWKEKRRQKDGSGNQEKS